MKAYLCLGVASAVITLWTPRLAFAADYYVAVSGNDSDAGTEAAPFATVGRGQQAAAAGDTVWVRGGTYAFSSGTVGVSFTKSGQSNQLIHYFAYPGETPIFDLSAINPSGRVTGFDVHTSYVHIRGMEIVGVPQYQNGQDSWGLRIQGNNNIIELMNVHHNEAPGIFITSGSNNWIVNCDSHHNYDILESGGSGDGFGCHSSGGGNRFTGCRAWENSDDGYDFINASGTCAVEDSWAWRNGWIPDTNTGAGNGAGFKAGGYGTDASKFPTSVPIHVVQTCVSWGNRTQGFYANHHPGPLHFFNNTAYNNPRNYDLLDDIRAGTHVLRNNVAHGSGGTLSNSTSDDAQANSWDVGGSSDAQFQGLNDTGAKGPRQADGALPELPFLHLAANSSWIDIGVDLGLPYNGALPDLGAFETGESDSTDTAPSTSDSPATDSSSSNGSSNEGPSDNTTGSEPSSVDSSGSDTTVPEATGAEVTVSGGVTAPDVSASADPTTASPDSALGTDAVTPTTAPTPSGTGATNVGLPPSSVGTTGGTAATPPGQAATGAAAATPGAPSTAPGGTTSTAVPPTTTSADGLSEPTNATLAGASDGKAGCACALHHRNPSSTLAWLPLFGLPFILRRKFRLN